MKINIILIAIIILTFGIRIYQLARVPISLHGDEIGVGYNAYTLLRYGLDEYGTNLPIVLRADVAPFIFYATILAIFVFGLTEFAVRFPSVIIGTATIFIYYLLIKELLSFVIRSIPNNILTFYDFSLKKVALLTILLIAVSPWHIQISRIAHDASYGLLCQIFALYCLFKFINNRNPLWLFISFISFGVTFYTYHSPRLTSPLIMIWSICLVRNKINYRKFWFPVIIFLIIILPIIMDLLSKPLAQTRFGGINIFIRTQPHESFFNLPSRLAVNYLNQFNPQHLFLDNSSTRYFNVKGIGLLYLISLPFLLIGIYYLIKTPLLNWWIFGWLVISVLPGALTLGPPNAGRILILFPILDFITALGIIIFLKQVLRCHYSINKLFYTLVLLSITLFYGNSVYYFLKQYLIDSPNRFFSQWQYGVKQVAQYAISQEYQVNKIIISDSIKQGYIYVLFYGQKDPLWLLQLPNKVKHTFVGYQKFGQYEFRDINWIKDQSLNHTLIIGTKTDIPKNHTIDSILTPTDEDLYRITKTKSIN